MLFLTFVFQWNIPIQQINDSYKVRCSEIQCGKERNSMWKREIQRRWSSFIS